MFKKIIAIMVVSLIFVLGFNLGRLSLNSTSLIPEAKAVGASPGPQDCSGWFINYCKYEGLHSEGPVPYHIYTVEIQHKDYPNRRIGHRDISKSVPWRGGGITMIITTK